MNYILKKKTNKLNSLELNNLKKYYISFQARRKQKKNIEFIDINEQFVSFVKLMQLSRISLHYRILSDR